MSSSAGDERSRQMYRWRHNWDTEASLGGVGWASQTRVYCKNWDGKNFLFSVYLIILYFFRERINNIRRLAN